MRMQEVILQLRELAPGAAASVRSACAEFDTMRMVLLDASHAGSYESIKVLTDTCLKKAHLVLDALERAKELTGELNDLNAAYKEKIGPRAKKPKDAPGQQMLPGLEDVCRTPSFMQSGRHG